jgi:four helix bundle protein
MPPSQQFDHERLEVYQLELEFITWATDLMEELRSESRSSVREVIQQLDRASLSSLLNTAEGNGRRKSQQRARFFDDARGSATECAACLDALVAKRASRPDRIAKGKVMLLRVVSMLSKLVARFDQASKQGHSLREDMANYEVGCQTTRTFENEDE